MNKKKSILECNVLYTIIAIIIGFLVGAIFLTIAGISPAVAYGKLFSSISVSRSTWYGPWFTQHR